jgi:endonuclease/exonuclease/phosphatase family metal-dependent hydrolase
MGSVDHIYFAPANRLVSYSCHVIDDELTRRVSDHLPVVADIEIR